MTKNQLNANGEIKAAGGIVLSQEGGSTRVLLVHRPRYGDWSLPKGKTLPGESDADAALREVAEETGLRCALEAEAGILHYRDRKDRPKIVRYWAMAPLEGQFVPNEEVDEVVWLELGVAAAKATRSGERELIARIARGVLPTEVFE